MYFLVTTNHKERTTEVKEYPNELRDLAFVDYSEAELSLIEFSFDESAPIKICLFGAESLDVLKKTHGSWFYK